MTEQPVFLSAGSIRLQGMFSPASPDSPHPAAVICHPHPAYGGTMDNNVVLAVTRALQDTGHSTLRFNFRGVGRSEGRHAGGAGEIEDVRAAIRFVQEEAESGDSSIILAGYSFGSWVAANVLGGDSSVSHLILVAPPTSMFDFSMLSEDEEERARHFIVGERDQFCDLDLLRDIFDRLPEPKTIRVVPRADHFFFAREAAVVEAVKEAIADHLA
ncbi:MAG: alpha/beta fold hydrolase [Candidatus Hydrogenedentota bacterium]|nr:MAG: alpha/beta fold hydrolase [Candidatus Hydrogenedentota bacterium]